RRGVGGTSAVEVGGGHLGWPNQAGVGDGGGERAVTIIAENGHGPLPDDVPEVIGDGDVNVAIAVEVGGRDLRWVAPTRIIQSRAKMSTANVWEEADRTGATHRQIRQGIAVEVGDGDPGSIGRSGVGG